METAEIFIVTILEKKINQNTSDFEEFEFYLGRRLALQPQLLSSTDYFYGPNYYYFFFYRKFCNKKQKTKSLYVMIRNPD